MKSLQSLTILCISMGVWYPTTSTIAASHKRTNQNKKKSSDYLRVGALQLRGTEPIYAAGTQYYDSGTAIVFDGAGGIDWSNQGTKTLSVTYSPSGSDAGNAQLQHECIKYQLKTYAVAKLDQYYYDPAPDVHAAVAVYVAKDGVQAMTSSAASSRDAQTYTLTAGPMSFNVYSTAGSKDEKDPQPVPFPINYTNGAVYAAGISTYYAVSLSAWASGSNSSGYVDKASSFGGAWGHTLTASEGQYTVKQAFQWSKAP